MASDAHRKAAEDALSRIPNASPEGTAALLAIAQVHATLALVEAVDNLNDTLDDAGIKAGLDNVATEIMRTR